MMSMTMDIRDVLPLHVVAPGDVVAGLMSRHGKRLSRRPPVVLAPHEYPTGIGDTGRIQALATKFLGRAEMTPPRRWPGQWRLERWGASSAALAHKETIPAALALAVGHRWRRLHGYRDGGPLRGAIHASSTALYLGLGAVLLQAAVLDDGRPRAPNPARSWRPGEPLPEDPGPGGGRVLAVGEIAASTMAFMLAVIVTCGRLDEARRLQLIRSIGEPQRRFYVACQRWVDAQQSGSDWDAESVTLPPLIAEAG